VCGRGRRRGGEGGERYIERVEREGRRKTERVRALTQSKANSIQSKVSSLPLSHTHTYTHTHTHTHGYL